MPKTYFLTYYTRSLFYNNYNLMHCGRGKNYYHHELRHKLATVQQICANEASNTQLLFSVSADSYSWLWYIFLNIIYFVYLWKWSMRTNYCTRTDLVTRAPNAISLANFNMRYSTRSRWHDKKKKITIRLLTLYFFNLKYFMVIYYKWYEIFKNILLSIIRIERSI